MQPGLPHAEVMHRAVERSDAAFDGVFFIAVRTTGIFCRPSCTARKPLPRNREFYRTAREALLAGYRACKRCRPLELPGSPPAWATDLLARVAASPERRWRDRELRALGVAPERARRYFRRQFGCTFQAYCRAMRLGGAMRQLRLGQTIDRAGLDNGFESASGFREAFSRLFGAPPGRARKGRHIAVRWLDSPLGPLVAGAVDEGVCLLEFTDRRALESQVATLRKRFECPALPAEHPLLAVLEDELSEYWSGHRRAFDVPLVHPGTPFEEAVWRLLREIPYGQRRSYEELALELGRPGGQRAVGCANGRNRIGILIPCHRVVNKDGRLCGYGGGLWRKQWLLDLESGARTTDAASPREWALA